MKIKTGRFQVKPGSDVDLAEWPTRVEPFYQGKPGYEAMLDEHVKELRKLQPKLYAHDRYALLIIFQGMDAAGKDGAIKHVMSGVNPQGVNVTSFRHPGPDALAHDFLWNPATRLPERGRIGIFNRSYYEEVLIVRVHPDLSRRNNCRRKPLRMSRYGRSGFDPCGDWSATCIPTAHAS